MDATRPAGLDVILAGSGANENEKTATKSQREQVRRITVDEANAMLRYH